FVRARPLNAYPRPPFVHARPLNGYARPRWRRLHGDSQRDKAKRPLRDDRWLTLEFLSLGLKQCPHAPTSRRRALLARVFRKTRAADAFPARMGRRVGGAD